MSDIHEKNVSTEDKIFRYDYVERIAKILAARYPTHGWNYAVSVAWEIYKTT